MPKRAPTTLQADVAHAVQAARKAGATEVVVEIPGQATITIRFTFDPEKNKHFEDGEIIL
jgi:hypothetical protein